MTSVLVDGRALYGNSRFSGIGTYVRHLTESLGARSDIDVSLLVTDDVAVPAGIERVRVARRLPERLAGWEHDVLLPGGIRRHPTDVFHSPAQDPPARVDRPWVQTVHDVIPLVVDHRWFDDERVQWRRRAQRIRTADLVIADSCATADDATRLLGLDADRVRVVHLGVDPRYAPDNRTPPDGLSWMLAVSEFAPHKGFEELFEVVARCADAGETCRLKLAGRVHDSLKPMFDHILRASRRPDLVDVLGFVSTEELVRLQQGATLFLAPSRYEGFGLPVLEAMACGAPVVAFANSAQVEVVDGGGVLVPDGDVGAMTDAVVALLRDASERDVWRARGIDRARQFSWERCAQETVAVYTELAGSAPKTDR